MLSEWIGCAAKFKSKAAPIRQEWAKTIEKPLKND
jgi:hypothetical protein